MIQEQVPSSTMPFDDPIALPSSITASSSSDYHEELFSSAAETAPHPFNPIIDLAWFIPSSRLFRMW